MDKICRLCCSTEFVSNYIFDENTGLYLKMCLYLPIKVFKNDRLPQNICDICSCKVNDFYQFCNETIEVQNRLRQFLYDRDEDEAIEGEANEDVKPSHPHVPSIKSDCKDFQPTPDDSVEINSVEIEVKVEPQDLQTDSDSDPVPDNHTEIPTRNSDSDDKPIVELKKKKRKYTRKPKKAANSSNSLAASSSDKPNIKKESMVDNLVDVDKSVDKSVDISPEVPFVFDNDTPLELRLEMMKDEDGLEDIVEQKPPKRGKSREHFCCVCMAECKSKKKMLLHYEQHIMDYGTPTEFVEPPMPAERPIKCNRCYAVLTEEEWSEHWWRHWQIDNRPLSCALCPCTMQSPGSALQHSLKHSRTEIASAADAEAANEPRFGCDLCELTFRTKRVLMSHRTIVHPGALGGPFVLRCSVCSRTFARASSLHRHMRGHRGVREHLCNVCGKVLSSSEHLKFHIRIHTGYRPHVCQICNKKFKAKYDLTVHERTHTGTKPHVCATCGRGFSQRSPLVIHQRTHTGERPYVCKLCGRGFVAQGLLTMHQKTTCI